MPLAMRAGGSADFARLGVVATMRAGLKRHRRSHFGACRQGGLPCEGPKGAAPVSAASPAIVEQRSPAARIGIIPVQDQVAKHRKQGHQEQYSTESPSARNRRARGRSLRLTRLPVLGQKNRQANNHHQRREASDQADRKQGYPAVIRNPRLASASCIRRRTSLASSRRVDRVELRSAVAALQGDGLDLFATRRDSARVAPGRQGRPLRRLPSPATRPRGTVGSTAADFDQRDGGTGRRPGR